MEQQQLVVDAIEWDQVLRDLPAFVKTFERAVRLRSANSIRQSHLKKQVRCLDCQARFEEDYRSIWVPNKAIRSCPRCTVCGRNLAMGKKQGSIPKTCPHCEGAKCSSKRFVSASRTDPFTEAYLPMLTNTESVLRQELEAIIGQHLVWTEWGQYVKGIGRINLGRILGHCDIRRLTTVGKMWAHAGLGLKNGEPQDRRKGQVLDYDKDLNTAAYMLGNSLLKAGDSYYRLYRNWKTRFLNQGLSKGHAHNKAFRNMCKMALSHIWEIWRGCEGYEVREPYAIAYLGHNRYIRPGEMLRQ